MKIRLLLLIAIFFFFIGKASAQTVQPGPMANTYVHDFAGVIPADKQSEINAKAKRLKDEFKTEIALVVIDSLNGEDQFDYSMRMARSWGIGSPDNEVRGLLVLVAVKDHKTSFRTSRHIEGELPDGVTGDISRAMNAFFKKGDFGNGLSAGMDQILAHLETVNASQQPQQPQAEGKSGLVGCFWLLLVFGVSGLFGTLFVKRRRGRKEAEAVKRFQTYMESRDRDTGRYAPPVYTPLTGPRSPHNVCDDRRSAYSSGKSTSSPSRSSRGGSSHSTPAPSTPSWSSSDSGYSSGSSSYDSGSSYSGGNDFGGGGSDSSW